MTNKTSHHSRVITWNKLETQSHWTHSLNEPINPLERDLRLIVEQITCKATIPDYQCVRRHE